MRSNLHSVKSRGAGVDAGDVGEVPGEGATKLQVGAKVGEQQRPLPAAFIVDGNETIVALGIEGGKALRVGVTHEANVHEEWDAPAPATRTTGP